MKENLKHSKIMYFTALNSNKSSKHEQFKQKTFLQVKKKKLNILLIGSIKNEQMSEYQSSKF